MLGSVLRDSEIIQKVLVVAWLAELLFVCWPVLCARRIRPCTKNNCLQLLELSCERSLCLRKPACNNFVFAICNPKAPTASDRENHEFQLVISTHMLLIEDESVVDFILRAEAEEATTSMLAYPLHPLRWQWCPFPRKIFASSVRLFTFAHL